jgi:cytochrome P450
LPKAQEIYYPLKCVIGPHSLITVEGDHWQKLRKMFNPAFSQGHLETLVPGIVEETLVLVTKLNEAAKTNETLRILDVITVSPLPFFYILVTLVAYLGRHWTVNVL